MDESPKYTETSFRAAGARAHKGVGGQGVQGKRCIKASCRVCNSVSLFVGVYWKRVF